MTFIKMIFFVVVMINICYLISNVSAHWKPEHMTYIIIDHDTLKAHGNFSMDMPPHTTIHGTETDSSSTVEFLNYKNINYDTTRDTFINNVGSQNNNVGSGTQVINNK